MPVSLMLKASTESAPASPPCSVLQPLSAGPTRNAYAAALGELEGVGEQVLEHLAQAAGIRAIIAGCSGASSTEKDRPCFLGHGVEFPLDRAP